TKLKILQGNPGKRKLNKQEPQPEAAIPECPEHLSAEAKPEWEAMSQRLYKAGLLTHLDRAALAAYCQAWGRWIEAERMLSKYGSVIKAPPGTLMQSPHPPLAK